MSTRICAARFVRCAVAVVLSFFAIQGEARGGEAEPDRFPTGRIVERVPTRSDARFSFALYLPSGFDPGRSWPLLLVLDPRGRGALAAERFREPAEEYGWIIVSSNDTKSDDASTPNADILQALWMDSFTRFPADPK
ncbi:MAG TPA: hypothetical protein VIZ69_06445, partial [Thermoanaerobaculia bacterium]